MRNRDSGWYRAYRDEESGSYRIDVYGDIGEASWWDDEDTSMSASKFSGLVKEAGGSPIDLHVNSGGGSVFDAVAMMSALSEYSAPVTAYVDGIAASAASVLLAAADSVRVAENAFVMIHNASTFAMGNSGDLRKQADLLDTVDSMIAGVYAKRSSGAKTEEDFAAAMRDTTWFDAQAAVEWGIADEVFETVRARPGAVETEDRATLRALDSASPQVAAHFKAIPAAQDRGGLEKGGDVGQEPGASAQERVLVANGQIFRTIE